MSPKHKGLNKLFIIADAFDFGKGIIELGYALPNSNAEKFLEGVDSLARSLGGICYADLSFDEFDKIVDEAMIQKKLNNRGLRVISKPETS